VNSVDIIGIDCSTNHRKLGIAKGHYSDGKLSITEVTTGQPNHVQTISSWLKKSTRSLIALDAPLGWPQAMGANLASHRAGAVIDIEPNSMFRRHTDWFIKQKIGKQSLDVGSNLIARTALFALNLIDSIRKETGSPIPLAWSPQFVETSAAIEVYPAATLEARGISSSGYKKPAQLDRRREILSLLGGEIQVECDEEKIVANDDNLDAVLCLLAAADFVGNKAYKPPPDMKHTVEKESWIWVKRK
jgi:hypothetical protein